MGEQNPRGRMTRKGRGLGDLSLRSHGSNSLLLLLLLWKFADKWGLCLGQSGSPRNPTGLSGSRLRLSSPRTVSLFL